MFSFQCFETYVSHQAAGGSRVTTCCRGDRKIDRARGCGAIDLRDRPIDRLKRQALAMDIKFDVEYFLLHSTVDRHFAGTIDRHLTN